jgi:hypothetical protein
MKSSDLKLASICLIVVLSKTCAAASENNSANTSHMNWRLCRNTELGFELLYPPDWKIYYASSSQGAGDRPPIELNSCEDANLRDGVILSPKKFDGGLSVDVTNLKTTIYAGVDTLNEYLSKNPFEVRDDPVVSNTIVDGEKAVVLKHGSILVFHNGYEYNLMCFSRGNVASCHAARKTFKFLE